MMPDIRADEEFLTVGEIAERLKLKPDTIRRLFLTEPGVIVISAPKKGRRMYRTLRIPNSVYQRVLTRMAHVE
jgi:hypothetical protein